MNVTQPVEKPVLLLDENRCRKNIRNMVKKTSDAGCIFRPHFKTHQSAEIGQWFRSEGVRGITVSSTSMAAYFADSGWDDITIAFPFFRTQIPALQQLEKKCSLRLFVNRIKDLEIISRELQNPFRFYIEINPGFGRSGIHFEDIDHIQDLIRISEKQPRCNFHGFYIHDGRTYQAQGHSKILDKAKVPVSVLRSLKEKFPSGKTSMGDTPSASVLTDFDGIDELTPGNFVFYDWMQVQIGSCTPDDVALFILLPVAQHTSPGKAIVHGGAAHLSKEFLRTDGKTNFGQQISFAEDNSVKKLNGYISAVSQEHGTLTGFEEDTLTENYVCICPVHSCLTANLHSVYQKADGTLIEKRILS